MQSATFLISYWININRNQASLQPLTHNSVEETDGHTPSWLDTDSLGLKNIQNSKSKSKWWQVTFLVSHNVDTQRMSFQTPQVDNFLNVPRTTGNINFYDI